MNKKAMGYVEIVFDTAYLLFAIIAGLFMIIKSGDNTGLLMYGLMSLVLGLGDSFHLVPRIYSHIKGESKKLTRALGIGKLVTSITMTAFYVILFYTEEFILGYPMPKFISSFVVLLAIARVVLCLFPQNNWTSKEGNLEFAIYRNIPFALMGLVVLIQYAVTGSGAFTFIWLAILLSFYFYIPVVLFSHKKPALGALMLPKTLCYVYIIAVGLTLI